MPWTKSEIALEFDAPDSGSQRTPEILKDLLPRGLVAPPLRYVSVKLLSVHISDASKIQKQHSLKGG